ncbi:hypothetical protein BGP79_11765 [Tersicoccus sp. Bi-70]|nr:hypothetical protein BGP79_11765 [Tersicoccus sp. Bi-70]
MADEMPGLDAVSALVDELEPVCTIADAITLRAGQPEPCAIRPGYSVRLHRCGDPAGSLVTACRPHLNSLAGVMEHLILAHHLAAIGCPRCEERLMLPDGVLWEVTDL